MQKANPIIPGVEPKAGQKVESEPPQHLRQRWMIIKKLTRDQVEQLHATEKKWFAVQQQRRKAGERLVPEMGWENRGISLLLTFSEAMGSFWPPRSPGLWREAETKRFKAHIFKIWRPIWNRYDQEQIGILEAVHAIDQKIIFDPIVFPPTSVTASGPAGEYDRIKRGEARQETLTDDEARFP